MAKWYFPTLQLGALWLTITQVASREVRACGKARLIQAEAAEWPSSWRMLRKEGLSWPCPGGRWILALLIGSGGLAVSVWGGSNRREITLDVGNSVRQMREAGSKQGGPG